MSVKKRKLSMMSDLHSIIELYFPEIDFSLDDSKFVLNLASQFVHFFSTHPGSGILSQLQLNMLPSMAAMVRSGDRSSWLEATKWFHRWLSHEHSPPIKEVLQSRVLHMFVLFLTMEDFPEIQEAAAQVLIRVASGTSKFFRAMNPTHRDPTQRALMLLLDSDDEEVLCHACTSLAVVSGCVNVNLTELILKADLYPRLRQLISHDSPTVVFGALRILENVMEGNENLMHSDGGYTEMHRLLNHTNMGIRKEACWAISFVCAGPEWAIQHVIAAGLMTPLVNMLETTDDGIRQGAALAISNATSGATNEQIKYLVDLGCIRGLCLQFCCSHKGILDASLNALENIMKSGETLKKDKDDVNQYAAYMYGIGGWGLLADVDKFYDYEIYRKALLLEKRYSVYPGDEAED